MVKRIPRVSANYPWRPPRLRIGEGSEDERHATWLELFFDLVFVAAIAQLGIRLSHDTTWDGLLKFLMLFIPVWWAWVGPAFYATRFDADDPLHRFLTLAQMAAVAALAVNVHDGLGVGSRGFTLAYASVRVVLVIEYVRAGRHIVRARPLTRRYSMGFGLAAAIWLISALTPVPLRFVLWGLGLVVDVGTPLLAGQLHSDLAPHPMHLPERFGLFTLIVLGESVMAVVAGVARQQWNPASAISAFLAMTVAFSLWWIYFDTMDDQAIKAARAGRVRLYQVWLYAHLPLVVGLAATGVGVQELLISVQRTAAPIAVRWLFCGSLAACLASLGLIHLAAAGPGLARCSRRSAHHHSIAAVAVLATALPNLPPVAILALTALICASQVIADLPLAGH
jgi:low temperature requirement protein LtrA